MREEQTLRASPVIYRVGKTYGTIDFSRHAGFEASQKIKQLQKDIKEDGYYLFLGVVYRVYCVNGLVKKITGDIAKGVKLEFKRYAAQTQTASL